MQTAPSLPTIIQDLNDLPQTPQAIFDHAVKHLYIQNWQKCHKPGEPDKCMYRNDEGMACGVGCFLPDDTVDLNGWSINKLSVTVSTLWNGGMTMTNDENNRMVSEAALDSTKLRDYLKKNNKLFTAIQDAHDQSHDSVSMWNYFEQVASDEQLNTTYLDGVRPENI